MSDPEVENSIPLARKWLDKGLHEAKGVPYFPGKPSEHLDDQDKLDIILQHAKAYAKYKKLQKS